MNFILSIDNLLSSKLEIAYSGTLGDGVLSIAVSRAFLLIYQVLLVNVVGGLF